MHSTTLAQNPATKKRGKQSASKIQQLPLLASFDTEPVAPAIPPNPLIAEIDNANRGFWKCDRYRIRCARTEKEVGFPFYEHEVAFVLSRFKGRRSPVTLVEFGAVAEVAVKLPKPQQQGVAV